VGGKAWFEILDHVHNQSPWRAYISGGPGAGKSLLLKMTARRLATEAMGRLNKGEDPERIPLPIYCRFDSLTKLGIKSDTNPSTALRQAISYDIQYRFATDERFAGYLSQHANEQRAWLVVDDVEDRVHLDNVDWVFRQLDRYQSHLVFAARPYDYSPPFQVKPYRLAELSRDQIGDFLHRRFLAESQVAAISSLLETSSSARELAANPLLLTLLCWCCERAILPKELMRSELYDRLLR
jgi:hypothetical protein